LMESTQLREAMDSCWQEGDFSIGLHCPAEYIQNWR